LSWIPACAGMTRGRGCVGPCRVRGNDGEGRVGALDDPSCPVSSPPRKRGSRLTPRAPAGRACPPAAGGRAIPLLPALRTRGIHMPPVRRTPRGVHRTLTENPAASGEMPPLRRVLPTGYYLSRCWPRAAPKSLQVPLPRTRRSFVDPLGCGLASRLLAAALGKLCRRPEITDSKARQPGWPSNGRPVGLLDILARTG